MSYLQLSPLRVRVLLILALFAAIFLTASLGATDRSTKTDNFSYLLREGTKLNAASGFFQTAGDRTIFFTQSDKRRFICLENLVIQRIGAEPSDAEWRIRGTVTEYNGENYLLIEMAVMTSVH